MVRPNELSELSKTDSRGYRFLDVDWPILDPWDDPYHYEPSSDAASFRVFSLPDFRLAGTFSVADWWLDGVLLDWLALGRTSPRASVRAKSSTPCGPPRPV